MKQKELILMFKYFKISAVAFIFFLGGFFLKGQNLGSISVSHEEGIEKMMQERKENTCTPEPPADPCHGQNRIQGFTILISFNKNRQIIIEQKSDFEKQFPDLLINFVYDNPDYKIQSGTYLTKEAAQNDLLRVRKTYRNAILVPEMIRCNKTLP